MVEAEEIVLEPVGLVLNIDRDLFQFVRQNLISMALSQNQKLVEGQEINIELFDYSFGIPFRVKATLPKDVEVTVSQRTRLQILGKPESYDRLKDNMLIPEALSALKILAELMKDHEEVLEEIVGRLLTISTNLDNIVGRIEALEKKKEK